ncbi:hypothetical protein FQY83_12925 [Luteimonas marina]|uniref:Uncharacterized protein n=1 Tax=Luteimonas marina TaxID=488485 RepID=A0A5C5U150_9GAMM|nr:hypothetical protein [Luteimonas marina]TWT19255.1 hypothetical protein FQY83_12925 [Luteimonas marina]
MNGLPNTAACLCVAVLALSPLLGGCQRAGNPIAEAAIQRATEHQGGTAQDTGQHAARGDGRASPQSRESLTLPEGFPEDVYLPRAYAVNSVMDLQDVSVLSLRAPGKVASLYSDARDAMRTQGWKQTLAAQHSVDTAMLAFEKDSDAGRRSATLSFNRNNGDEHVIVGVQLRALQSQ